MARKNPAAGRWCLWQRDMWRFKGDSGRQAVRPAADRFRLCFPAGSFLLSGESGFASAFFRLRNRDAVFQGSGKPRALRVLGIFGDALQGLTTCDAARKVGEPRNIAALVGISEDLKTVGERKVVVDRFHGLITLRRGPADGKKMTRQRENTI